VQVPLNVRAFNYVEKEILPARSELSVHISHDDGMGYCMYGSESCSTWSGTLCDGDSVPSTCKWFVPQVTVEEAVKTHDALMVDDKYVYANYPDIAALQWVIEDRISTRKPWYYLMVFFLTTFIRKLSNFARKKKNPELNVGKSEELRGLWDDSIKNSRT
jgi:hypothetical protein